MTRTLVLHIDRLVLKGVRREDRDAMAQALQQALGDALTEALAEPQALARVAAAAHVARLAVPAVRLDAGAAAQQIGARVGQGIGREIGR